jgi:hypothetical protein
MDKWCYAGDSGGPTCNGYLAKGLISAKSRRYRVCFYSHIQIAANRLSGPD